MGLPVYDLSGLDSLLCDSYLDATVALSWHACQARAFQRCKDAVVCEVFTEGRETYALLAVIKANRTAQGAQHIAQTLAPAVRRAIRQRKPDKAQHAQPSMLWSALTAISGSFSKASMSPESLLPQSTLAAALLRPCAQCIQTLWYGWGSQAPLITTSSGSCVAASTTANHYTSHTNVFEATHTGLDGAFSVVMGSPGLWEHIHPRRAAANAAAYTPPPAAAPASLGGGIPSTVTPPSLTGPAAPIVLAALRHIVRKCRASHDPRLACLTDVKQLDRIPPGSRAEAFGGIIVPRFRGDVHNDLTALVATAAFAPAGPASPRALPRHKCPFSTAIARLRPVSSESSLQECSSGPLRRLGSKVGLADATQSLQSVPKRFLESFRGCRGRTPSADATDATSKIAAAFSETVRSDGTGRTASPRSPLTTMSTQGLGSPPPRATVSAAALRWHAVRIYARALQAEARLRTELWGDAVHAVRRTRGGAATAAPLAAAAAPAASGTASDSGMSSRTRSEQQLPSEGDASTAGRESNAMALDMESRHHATASLDSCPVSSQSFGRRESAHGCPVRPDSFGQAPGGLGAHDIGPSIVPMSTDSAASMQLRMPSAVVTEMDGARVVTAGEHAHTEGGDSGDCRGEGALSESRDAQRRLLSPTALAC